MSERARARDAIAEINCDTDAPALVLVGARPLHHYWPLLAAYFRDILLPPHRQADGSTVAWTWHEPANAKPASAGELASVRKRLALDQQLFADNLARAGVGAASGDAGLHAQANVDQLGHTVAAVVTQLRGRSDAELATFVCRSEAGLRVHSWSSIRPATPRYPEAEVRAIAGQVRRRSKPCRAQVVLRTAAGHEVARLGTGKDGGFRFEEILPGEYRLEAEARGAEFPAVPVVMGRESILGILIDDTTAVPPAAVRISRRTLRRLGWWGVAAGVVVAGIVGISRWLATEDAAGAPAAVITTSDGESSRSASRAVAARGPERAAPTRSRAADDVAPRVRRPEAIAASSPRPMSRAEATESAETTEMATVAPGSAHTREVIAPGSPAGNAAAPGSGAATGTSQAPSVGGGGAGPGGGSASSGGISAAGAARGASGQPAARAPAGAVAANSRPGEGADPSERRPAAPAGEPGGDVTRSGREREAAPMENAPRVKKSERAVESSPAEAAASSVAMPDGTPASGAAAMEPAEGARTATTPPETAPRLGDTTASADETRGRPQEAYPRAEARRDTPAGPGAMSASENRAYVAELRIHMAPWEPQLVTDVILPTAPVRRGATDDRLKTREQLIAELAARRPAGQAETEIHASLRFSWHRATTGAVHWTNSRGEPDTYGTVAVDAASFTLRRDGGWRLADARGETLAEIDVIAGGRECTARLAQGVDAHLVFEHAREATARVGWRVGAGELRAVQDSTRERRLVVPTRLGTAGPQPIALYDAATGWAVVTRVTQRRIEWGR